MNGKGFLGTNASVLADISLIMGILVALTLTGIARPIPWLITAYARSIWKIAPSSWR